MNNRTTPTKISKLNENEIFVFGSNGEGNHAAGAAKTAVKNFGAIQGQSEGWYRKKWMVKKLKQIHGTNLQKENSPHQNRKYQ